MTGTYALMGAIVCAALVALVAGINMVDRGTPRPGEADQTPRPDRKVGCALIAAALAGSVLLLWLGLRTQPEPRRQCWPVEAVDGTVTQQCRNGADR